MLHGLDKESTVWLNTSLLWTKHLFVDVNSTQSPRSHPWRSADSTRKPFSFLAGLAKNNSKAWFDQHRADYEEHCLEPAKAFVEAIGPQLRKISKTVNYEPRVNGSIFRMNRDVRFSKDKTPYKTNLDFWFWEGGKRGWETPGFFLRLTSTAVVAGAGMHHFQSPETLAAYRKAVLDAKAGRELEQITAKLTPAELGEATRKTVPKGFDKDHPRAAYLLHEGLYAMREQKLPKSVFGPSFVVDCMAEFRRAAPISAWLTKHVVKVK